MKLSIKKQFLVLFILVSGVGAIVLASILKTGVDSCFYDYRWADQRRMFDFIIQQLKFHYAVYQTWDNFNGTELEKFAMREGCFFTLHDQNDKVIWSSEGQLRPIHNSNDKYWRDIYPIEYANNVIGKVYIGQLTNNLFSEEDKNFKSNVTYYLASALFFALIICLPFIIYLSTKLSIPIKQLQKQADNMIKGNLTNEIRVKSSTVEILKLTDSLNRLRISLHDQETLRKQLASDISHELRTPLNIIQNELEAMIDGIFEINNERLEGLHAEIVRLTSLVRELENITHIESDSFIPDIQNIQLDDIIQHTVSTFEATFHRKGIDLIMDLQHGIIVKAQADKLAQVIVNIISNALKYTEEGSVTVRSYMTKNYAVFEVTDTGSGLSEADKSKIFERFYRVEKSRNRNAGGAGLGLSIVKKIVDAHGWHIEVESDGHSGTTFRVTF